MEELTLEESEKAWHGSLKDYLIGFISSLILTFASFFLVATKLLSKTATIYTIVALALVQAIFQLLFFLHVGKEPKPRWKLLIFFFMVMILLIIAIGSLWIMFDLDNRVMPEEMMHD